MPNAFHHRQISALTGGAFALYQARNQPALHAVVEAVYGALGGCMGALAPDIIDPPTSPRHRSVDHGIANVGAVLVLGYAWFEKAQEWLRTKADQLMRDADAAVDGWTRFGLAAAGVACVAASGLLAGFIAGYLAHLGMDALTPAGLPVFCSGC